MRAQAQAATIGVEVADCYTSMPIPRSAWMGSASLPPSGQRSAMIRSAVLHDKGDDGGEGSDHSRDGGQQGQEVRLARRTSPTWSFVVSARAMAATTSDKPVMLDGMAADSPSTGSPMSLAVTARIYFRGEHEVEAELHRRSATCQDGRQLKVPTPSRSLPAEEVAEARGFADSFAPRLCATP